MIEPAESFPDVLTRLQRFLTLHGSTLSQPVLDRLMESANHPSPVERVVNSAEALYAVKNDLTKEGREITAQLAQFAAINGFHMMTERGQQIAQAMNRMGGYKAPAGTSWPAAEEDPEPLPQFVDTPPEGEAPPAPADEPAP